MKTKIENSRRCPLCKKNGLELVKVVGTRKKQLVCFKCFTRFTPKKWITSVLNVQSYFIVDITMENVKVKSLEFVLVAGVNLLTGN